MRSPIRFFLTLCFFLFCGSGSFAGHTETDPAGAHAALRAEHTAVKPFSGAGRHNDAIVIAESESEDDRALSFKKNLKAVKDFTAFFYFRTDWVTGGHRRQSPTAPHESWSASDAYLLFGVLRI